MNIFYSVVLVSRTLSYSLVTSYIIHTNPQKSLYIYYSVSFPILTQILKPFPFVLWNEWSIITSHLHHTLNISFKLCSNGNLNLSLRILINSTYHRSLYSKLVSSLFDIAMFNCLFILHLKGGEGGGGGERRGEKE